MRQIRSEAFGEDIGQCSWVSADEFRRDAQRLESEDRTASAFRNASGRLAAMRNHREGLERLFDAASLQDQHDLLAAVAELARRGAVSRIAYLTEVRSPRAG
jgi:hypothetical protein